MYYLLALTTVCAAGKAVVCKKLGADDKASRSIFSWNSGIYLVASVIAFFSLYPNFGKILSISPFTVLMATAFSVFLLFTQITEVRAMALGSVSMTILIYSGGFLFPIAYGYFILQGDQKETISPLCGIGIIVMMVAMALIIRPRKESGTSWHWVLMAFLSLIGSGMVAITQKHHQKANHAAYADEIACFVTLGLLLASLFSFVIARIERKKATPPPSFTKRDIAFVAISGLCIGMQNLLNLFLAGKLPSAVQFPVYNIGSMLLTALFGMIVLKEKHSIGQKIGFLLGCCSILLISY